MNYIAVIHQEDKSDYGVSFPDFPGCITAGSDLDEARELAEEALEFHIKGMTQDGELLPKPSDLRKIAREDKFKNTVKAYIVVPLKQKKLKSIRFNVMMEGNLLNHIDKYAEDHGMTRSGLLSVAAKEYISAAT